MTPAPQFESITFSGGEKYHEGMMFLCRERVNYPKEDTGPGEGEFTAKAGDALSVKEIDWNGMEERVVVRFENGGSSPAVSLEAIRQDVEQDRLVTISPRET